MKTVLIIGALYTYTELFSEISNVEAKEELLISEPGKIDLVVFTGGADVHPILYKGVHDGTSMVSYNRDVYEQAIFEWCQSHGIKTTGICRGFQFLNVMCGGFMYQHITGHGITGLHCAVFPKLDNQIIRVSSTHHQLVGLSETAISMAWAEPNLSSIYIGPDASVTEGPEHEIEAAIFPGYNSMGVQFHPEIMYDNSEGRRLYLQIVSDFVDYSFENFITKYGVANQCQKQDMEV